VSDYGGIQTGAAPSVLSQAICRLAVAGIQPVEAVGDATIEKFSPGQDRGSAHPHTSESPDSPGRLTFMVSVW